MADDVVGKVTGEATMELDLLPTLSSLPCGESELNILNSHQTLEDIDGSNNI